MNILIDIGHPAHVHNYRNLANQLVEKGHKVIWSVKNIPSAKYLLDYYGFKYYELSAKSDSLFSKILKQIKFNWEIFKICKKEKIDIALGTSVSIAHVSKLSRTASVLFDDDDDYVQPFITKYVNPFADVLITPKALLGNRKREDTIFYDGYHELAYLHPKYFEPDINVLKEIGINKGETFFIMRFNVFKAHHDKGIKGLTLDQKLKIIELLKPLGRILITTEREIEPELQQYQLKISQEKVHSLMAFATMFIADSQTMITEAALLGTPAIKCNSFAGKLSVPNEIEVKYELCNSFLPEDFDHFLLKIKELLALDDLKKRWEMKRNKMLNEKICVTDFWFWFIDNLPKSKEIMKESPDYQNNFK